MAWRFRETAFEVPSAGVMFAAVEAAIRERDDERFDRFVSLALAVPESRRGLLSAFGWVERPNLQGVVIRLLASAEPFRRMVGLAACAMHSVDPGLTQSRLICDSDPLPRARALRIAGQLAVVDLLDDVELMTHDENPDCRFWATWSALLLGNRNEALTELTQNKYHRRNSSRARVYRGTSGYADACRARDAARAVS